MESLNKNKLLNFSFLDDSVSANGVNKRALQIWKDNQGDLYFRITNTNGTYSDIIRMCGPGGGSRQEGLATKIKAAILQAEILDIN